MSDQKRKSGKKAESGASTRARKTLLEPAGEIEVVYQEVPPTPPEGKKIHKRRPLPRTPEAPEGENDADQ